jgi:membrane-bound lytic murein transglycosylase D
MSLPIRLFILLFFGAAYAAAPTLAAARLPLDQQPLKDSIKASLDSVVAEYIPFEPDELIQDRLSCVEQEIPLHFNKYVRGYVDYFTIRNRNYSRRVLGREHLYFPLFEKYLAQYNLPEELKYLSVVESALLTKAVSRAKAVGLWQFMPATGKGFRLHQDEYIDERMDPEKATEAACKFLRQLHRIYGDWELALAAYNYGPGNVNKAIKRSGKHKPGFWEIYAHLPAETRNYVPTFAAIIYTMKYAPEHNIFADSLQFPIPTDTVLVNQSLDLERFATELQMRPEDLMHLNPALRKNHLPASTKNYPLKVPAEKTFILALNRAAILDSSRWQLPVPKTQSPPVMLASKESKAAAGPKAEDRPAPNPATDSAQKFIYVVQKGDNLLRIARTHNVTVEELKEWNNIRNSTILPNQKLTVFQPQAILAQGTPAEAPAGEQPEEASEETALTQATASAAPVVVGSKAVAPSLPNKKAPAAAKKPAQKVQKIHSVQPGDTLWNISRRYDGLTVEHLKKVNKLKSNALKPGQKLVISTSS